MAALEPEPESGVAEWAVTFGDMMSLLLAFFVLLFSMSEIKQDRGAALIESLQRQFGSDAAGVGLMPGAFPWTESPLNKLPSIGRARRMNAMAAGSRFGASVDEYGRVTGRGPAEVGPQGGTVYFDEGSDRLDDEARKTLRHLARLIDAGPQIIEVRGHTSTVPIQRDWPYRNHWDLAYARSVKVMEYLVQQGIDTKRIRLGVAAENEPIQTGHDGLASKKNSRVEIFLLEAPGVGHQTRADLPPQ